MQTAVRTSLRLVCGILADFFPGDLIFTGHLLWLRDWSRGLAVPLWGMERKRNGGKPDLPLAGKPQIYIIQDKKMKKVFNFVADSQYDSKRDIDMRIAQLMDQKRRASDPNVKNDLQKRIDDLRVKKRYAK